MASPTKRRTSRRPCQAGSTRLSEETRLPNELRAVMALAQRVYVLHHGEIISSGTPQQVTTDPAVLESYLGAGAPH